MNISATKLLLGVSLLASAAVVACGDGEERSDGVGQPEIALSGSSSGSASAPGAPATSSSSSSGAPSTSSSSSSSSSGNAPDDAGAPPAQDAGPPPRSLALHCQGPSAPAGPVICIENAEGHAGDVVELEVHLLRPQACGTSSYATATFDVDPAKFELANADDQPSCLQRTTGPSFTTPTLAFVSWQAFGPGSAPAGCSAGAGIGKVDTIKLKIKPGTPAGDYEMKVLTSELLGGGPSCSGVFLDVSGTVRVLP